MSACFVCSVLELPKKKEPNWKAARRYVLSMPSRKLAEKLIVGLDLDLYLPGDEAQLDETSSRPRYVVVKDGNNYDLVDAVQTELQLENTTLRQYAIDAVEACEQMWDGNSEGGSIELSNCKILVAGESSYGDEPEGVGHIRVFEACGAAKAAGFLV